MNGLLSWKDVIVDPFDSTVAITTRGDLAIPVWVVPLHQATHRAPKLMRAVFAGWIDPRPDQHI